MEQGETAQIIELPLARGFDFVEGFLDLTDGIAAPEVYRLWAAISCVAAAMERRVWIETSQGSMYPNLYVMLVGAPGVGKDRPMNYVEKIFDDVPSLRMAPHSMTAASMLDDFDTVHRTVVREGKLVAEYHSMMVLANEFAVFCPGYELDFLGRLNYIYDNPRRLRVTRKYLKKEVNITHPQLNILAGAQPGLLATMLPEEAWSSGTMSRMIMIYAAQGPKVDIFGTRTEIVRSLRGSTRESNRTIEALRSHVVGEGCRANPERLAHVQRAADADALQAHVLLQQTDDLARPQARDGQRGLTGE